MLQGLCLDMVFELCWLLTGLWLGQVDADSEFGDFWFFFELVVFSWIGVLTVGDMLVTGSACF